MRRCFAVFLLQFALAAASAQQPARLSFRGHVYADDTGSPSLGASVILTEVSIFRRRSGVTTTDERGAFKFTGLTPGSYTLQIEKTNFLAEYVEYLANAAPAKDIVIRLRRGGVTGVGGGDAAGCHRCAGQGSEGGDDDEEPPAAVERDETDHWRFSLHFEGSVDVVVVR